MLNGSESRRSFDLNSFRPAELTVEMARGIPVDSILGGMNNYPETKKIAAHESLLESLREQNTETLLGTVYRRGKGQFLCSTGLTHPWNASGFGELSELVRDSPISTMIYVGDQQLPASQEGKQEYLRFRMQQAKNVMFHVGGLMESRLALEGVSSRILENLPDRNNWIVCGLSHSGEENSFIKGVNLTNFDHRQGLKTIQGGIARTLQILGKDNSQVGILMGHSMGGFYSEQAANSLRYPNALILQIAPVIFGTDLQKNPTARSGWLEEGEAQLREKILAGKSPLARKISEIDWNLKGYEPHVLVQGGILGSLIKLALEFPDIPPRDLAIQLVGPAIAGYFVGDRADHKAEAIAVIVDEIRHNRLALRAQQRALKGMPMIVDGPEQMSDNLRYVIAAGEDNTLAYIHQLIWRNLVFRKQDPDNMGAWLELAESSNRSQHNANSRAIDGMIAWVQMKLAERNAGKKPLIPVTSRQSSALTGKALSQLLSNNTH